MKQIERLIARLVQLVEDNRGQVVSITVLVDNNGNPTCWYVNQIRLEGLQDNKTVI